MLAVQIFAGEESRGKRLAEQLAEEVRSAEDADASKPGRQPDAPGERSGIRIIGPAPATIGRINDIFRFAFYVKSEKYDILIKIKDSLEEQLRQNPSGTETVQFDFDPMNTM